VIFEGARLIARNLLFIICWQRFEFFKEEFYKKNLLKLLVIVVTADLRQNNLTNVVFLAEITVKSVHLKQENLSWI
jgi:hypothetical protein